MDENTDLYDRYINGELSEEERATFEQRLSADAAFSEDFRMHQCIVAGLVKQAEKEDAEFIAAMKSLDRDEVAGIVGAGSGRPKKRNYHLWQWVSSVAAVALFGFWGVKQMSSHYDDKIDNMLYEYNLGTVSRGGSSVDSLQLRLSNHPDKNEIISIIDGLKKAYAEAPDDETEKAAGFNLALAYLYHHDRDNAKAVLSRLIEKYPKETAAEKILEELK